MVTILTTDTATDHGLTHTPLPLSMDNAKPFPGPANIRGMRANVAGQHDITVYAGPRASDADIAAAASIVASNSGPPRFGVADRHSRRLRAAS